MELINLTDFTIRLFDEDGQTVLLELPTDPPSVVAAEIIESVRPSDPPIIRRTHKVDVDDIPEPEEGVLFVVGFAVLQALKEMGVDRPDLVSPDTGRGSVIRDRHGRIVGVRRFRQL
jgi:hypothetical protein